MHQNEPSPDELADTNWLAFLYVADELSDDQRSQFQARLATDQSAREAVASAVELTQTIAATEVLTHTVEKTAYRSPFIDKWRRTTWIATAVAACLAIVVGYQFVSRVVQNTKDNSSSHVSQEGSSRMDNSVAQAWIKAADETSELDSFETALEELETESLAAEDMAEDATGRLEEAPDWMLAAVNGMAKSAKAGD